MSTIAHNKNLYAGMDLHSSNVFCGIIDAEGYRVFKKRLPNVPEQILPALKPFRDQLQSIAIESTYNWYWLVDILQEHDYPVRLANPARMQLYAGMKHTDDQSDAFWLAEMTRLNILPTGYIYPKNIRPLRDMLRRRLLIVRQRTQMTLSLQSMFVRHTGQQIAGTKLKTWTFQDIRAAFQDPYQQETARAMLELIWKQDRIEKKLVQSIEKRIRIIPAYERLCTVHGIGLILAVTIILETGPIDRFKSAGNYASYCRMVQSKCESNGKKKGENNRKNGNKHLNWAYIEAANYAQRYNPELQRWFQRKSARTKRVVATKALGCKLAKAVYYMLRDEKEFDVKKLIG